MGNEGTEHLRGTYCVQGIFPTFSLLILTITLQSPQFAEEEPEAQKGLCLTQGCRADKKGLHLNLVLSACEACLTYLWKLSMSFGNPPKGNLCS